MFPNLKNVKIVNSSGVCLKDHFKQGYDRLFKLSEFVLKNATVLEKFIYHIEDKKVQEMFDELCFHIFISIGWAIVRLPMSLLQFSDYLPGVSFPRLLVVSCLSI